MSGGGNTTDPKLQAPNPNALPNPNVQATNRGRWDLELGNPLGFGAWSLGVDFPVSIFPPSVRHLSQPPIRARALRPRFCSVSAARALVCSDGQAQYRTIGFFERRS